MSITDGTTRPRLWPMYLGGFLGPFAGQLVVPMLPEISTALDTSLQRAALSLTAYTLPFAIVLLISGTLAETWGRRRTVRIAYASYVLASAVCMVAPTIEWLYFGRALQGIANAFTTPVLVAAIYAAVAPERLGRSLGHFSSLQAAGMAFSPLIGGLAGAIDYRLAFLLTGAIGGLLAFVPPENAPPGAASVPLWSSDRWRPLANRRLLRACAIALAFNLSASAMTLLGSLLGADRFGLGPTGRGLLIACFGIAGLAIATWFGRLVERFGMHRVGLTGFILLSLCLVGAGVANALWELVLGVAVAGMATTGSRVIVNTLAVTSTPSNPSGATSMALAWMFLATAMTPVIFLPIYTASMVSGFLAAGVGAAVAFLLYLPKPAASELVRGRR